jgi:preprotein translocase subunit SecD
MQKHQIILGSILLLAVTTITSLAQPPTRSEAHSLTLSVQKQTRSKRDLQRGYRLIIRLKPTKEHPKIDRSDLDGVQTVFKNRLKDLGISGAVIQPIGKDRISVKLSGDSNLEQLKRVLGSTGSIEFREQKIGTEGQLNAEMAVLREARENQIVLEKTGDKKALRTTQSIVQKQYTEINKLFDRPKITGKQIVRANEEPLADGGGWNIAIEFDKKGAEAFRQLTKNLAGTGRSIGIFVDNNPISTPTVGAEFAATGITGGKAVIMGNFTPQTAADLAIELRGGALPMPVEIIETRKY